MATFAGRRLHTMIDNVADIIAIEQVGVMACRFELLLKAAGYGRFAGATQAGEP